MCCHPQLDYRSQGTEIFLSTIKASKVAEFLMFVETMHRDDISSSEITQRVRILAHAMQEIWITRLWWIFSITRLKVDCGEPPKTHQGLLQSLFLIRTFLYYFFEGFLWWISFWLTVVLECAIEMRLEYWKEVWIHGGFWTRARMIRIDSLFLTSLSYLTFTLYCIWVIGLGFISHKLSEIQIPLPTQLLTLPMQVIC